MAYWAEDCKRKQVDPHDLTELREQTHASGLTLASLNGSFDILHAGHLHIIYEASKCADKLIVALNSDSSIKKYKSEDRPIIPLRYRLEMLAALSFVDYVTWFDEVNPLALLERLRPDVHANGDEYGSDCIESEVVKKHGGKIHLVGKVPGLSTTEVINRIVHTCA